MARVEAGQKDAWKAYPYLNGQYIKNYCLMADEELGIVKILGKHASDFEKYEKEFLTPDISRDPRHPDFLLRGVVEILDEVSHKNRQEKGKRKKK